MSDAASHNQAFVQKEPIPASPPPAAASGPVRWVKDNLFSNIPSAILTVISALVIYKLVSLFFPWFFNGVWTGESIRDCREVLEGATGACFAVLVDRWDHLVFGLAYPADGYWRPTVAFLLLLVAAAPVMFANLPRKLLIFSAVYPFLAFFLIWGGSVWVPTVTALIIVATVLLFRAVSTQFSLVVRQIFGAFVGFVAAIGLAYLLFQGAVQLDTVIATSIGTETTGSMIMFGIFKLLAYFMYLFFIPMALFVGYAIYNSAEDGGLVSIVTALLFLLAAFNFAMGPIVDVLNTLLTIELPQVASRDMGGFMLNMILGTICVALSIPLGIVLALGRQSKMPLIKGVCVVFIEFIRGVPLITLLFVANVMLAYFLPPESNFDLILRVIIMMTMFSAAYIAEVIRGGLAALPRGQYEAADSLGLNYTQAMQLIILPQALKISIPGIVNVAVGLFKDTTLVSIISMFDTIGTIRGPIQQSTNWLGIYWELFGFAALLFFVVCYGISQYSQWLERQLNTERR